MEVNNNLNFVFSKENHIPFFEKINFLEAMDFMKRGITVYVWDDGYLEVNINTEIREFCYEETFKDLLERTFYIK